MKISMQNRLALVIAASMIGVSAYAQDDDQSAAAGDPEAGSGKVAVCLACHGEGGREPPAPIYPRLAGQSSEYLISSLQAYRSGLRQGGNSAMMGPQAVNLSDQDINDIAAYYSQQSQDANP